MCAGARTPEDLEVLLEDAFVMRDREALVQLFEPGAVFAPADGVPHARGNEEIARNAGCLWDHDCTYLADPRRILQAGDTALVLSQQAINVLRRDSRGAWRFAICCLNLDGATAWLP